jgi:hypothetical protein
MSLIDAMKSRVVGNWRLWLRLHTTYFFAAIAAMPEIWVSSPEFQSLLPLRVVAHIAPAIGVLGFLLRIRKQVNNSGNS